MSKLKRRVQQPNLEDAKNSLKINKSYIDRGIAVSFRYLTDAKRYSFSYFKNQWRDELSARQELDKAISALNANNWLQLGKLNKLQLGGFERLPYGAIEKSVFKRAEEVTPDLDIYSFRFSSGKYRLLGVTLSNSSVFYILGFDFDYSAYNHGS